MKLSRGFQYCEQIYHVFLAIIMYVCTDMRKTLKAGNTNIFILGRKKTFDDGYYLSIYLVVTVGKVEYVDL